MQQKKIIKENWKEKDISIRFKDIIKIKKEIPKEIYINYLEKVIKILLKSQY